MTKNAPTSSRETTPGTQVAPMFVERWSPRAMSGAPVDQATLNTLFEAARWAPSCFNAQPWQFAYVRRDTPGWDTVFDSLVAGNQAWATRAAVLIGVASRARYQHNDQPAPTHAFDAGAAWMSLALQASALGLVAHGMLGFDPDAATAAFKVEAPYQLHAIIAIGHPGKTEDLPEAYREREQPSPRKALHEIVFENHFGGHAP